VIFCGNSICLVWFFPPCGPAECQVWHMMQFRTFRGILSV
jgi:hypothetical protein